MKASLAALSLGLIGLAMARRPSNTSICDYYAAALLDTSNVTTQAILLTLVVNTAVIGNYTEPNVGIAVPGILAKGRYNNQNIDLLPYFNGALASTNPPASKVTKGVSVNWLDGGGADPLAMNQLGTEGSQQSVLMMHLYTYFAALLGCSEFGKTDTKYEGDPSMYHVHRYMGLSAAQVGYFIQQVGLSAASFGVAEDDVKAVGDALSMAFGHKCAPKTPIPAAAEPALQSICIEDDCPLAANATCEAYDRVMQPTYKNGTLVGNATGTAGAHGTGSGPKPTGTKGAPPSQSSHMNATGQAGRVGGGGSWMAMGVVGLAVALLSFE